MMSLILVLCFQSVFAQNNVVIDREYTVQAKVEKSVDVRSAINAELVKAVAKEFGTLDLTTPGSEEKLASLTRSSDRWIALSRPGELKVANEVAEQKIFLKLRLDELEKSLARFGFSGINQSQTSLLSIEGALPLSLQSRLKESIRIASRDIRALTERRIASNMITFEIAANGTLESIGSKLDGLRVGEFTLKVLRVDGNELKMGVSK